MAAKAHHRKPSTFGERRMAKLRVPFQDDELKNGPPRCTAADFQTPSLRKCPFDLTTIRWEERLGVGLDGCVWKVSFGESGPYILKAMSTIQCILTIAGLHFSLATLVLGHGAAAPVLHVLRYPAGMPECCLARDDAAGCCECRCLRADLGELGPEITR